ncbi:MAG: hypothetical protein RSD57_09915 [Comamonas sp.]
MEIYHSRVARQLISLFTSGLGFFGRLRSSSRLKSASEESLNISCPRSRLWRQIGVVLALSFSVFLTPMAAQAKQKILILLPDESAGAGGPYHDTLAAEFTVAGATVERRDILHTPNSVTPALFTSAPGPYDVVVVGSTYRAIDPSNWAALNSAIASRAASSFLFFIDSCCEGPPENTQGMSNLTPLIANASGWPGIGIGPAVGGMQTLPLNTSSPYASSFTGLPSIVGGAFSYMSNVPANNALYLPVDANSPVLTPTTDAYGLFIPATQSHGGNGACVFSVFDISPFDSGSYPSNKGKISSAFLSAVGAGGVCGLAASISKSFANSSLHPGGVTNLAISVTNHSNPVGSVGGLYISDTLPAPLVVSGPAVSNTCTGGTLSVTQGSNLISLTGATLPSTGCTLVVPVRWPVDAVSTCNGSAVTNTITPGNAADGGQFSTALGQVNTPAVADLSCTALPPPVPAAKPVPVWSTQALWWMSILILGGAGLYRARKDSV